MKYAICRYAVSPMRLQPDHRSEMTSQLLFGETVTILQEDEDGWWQVQKSWDNYIGWVRGNQFYRIDSLPQSPLYAAHWCSVVNCNGERIVIPYAAAVGNMQEAGISVMYDKGQLHHAGSVAFSKDAVQQVGEEFLNTAYLWGGKSVFGIDCSGFVQSVFRMFNIPLLRDAKDQVAQGELVAYLHAAQPGDVAFFDDESGNIVHVGILISPDTILHASGNVRYDKIDSFGIIHSETGKRTHNLRVIKRMQ